MCKCFKQYVADHRFFFVSYSPVETVHTDDAAKFKSGYSADLFIERVIRQEFTISNSVQLNGVTVTNVMSYDIFVLVKQ